MEQLVIHSKSYLVRWINVSPNHSISWSIQPHKKSISFGIFKHDGSSVGGRSPSFSHTPTPEPLPSPGLIPTISNDEAAKRPSALVPSNSASLVEKLDKVGLKSVAWMGKCEADKVSVGKYDVIEGEGGMYGLVFDNTHSKQLSKTVTFVLMTYPSNAPPKSGHHLHSSQFMAGTSSSSLTSSSPALLPQSDSHESLPQEHEGVKVVLQEPRPSSRQGVEKTTPQGATFYTGVLSKKRRKRNQGYARRFFSLDFTSSTLSYYKNRQSSALRGTIPLSLAAIGTNEKSREISIDSGAEIWLLRAINRKDFTGWRDALEKASIAAGSPLDIEAPTGLGITSNLPLRSNPAEDREWSQVEALVGRVAGITDAVRRLAKDTDPKYSPGALGLSNMSPGSNASTSPVETNRGDYFNTLDKPMEKANDKPVEKPPFWKRKASGSGQGSGSSSRRSTSASIPTSRSLGIPTPTNGAIHIAKRQNYADTISDEEGMHGHCMALLRDLDAVVSSFSSLIAQSKQRRMLSRPKPISRKSIESTRSDEFFDAEDGIQSPTQLLNIREDSDHEDEGAYREGSDAGDSNSTIGSDDEATQSIRTPRRDQSAMNTTRPKTLTPLPHDSVQRRSVIPPSAGAPPSLISFLRKNVGKDLSTIAMPVTANEPLSLLQRQAEQMEYSELLDSAARSLESGERLLYVTAFAISSLSSTRLKERAIRKPFNPMLGETFELVREDKGFRFLAEKISHRPVRVACQAESQDWTFTHAPMPTQKFWGKSAELITDGRARVDLYRTAESFSWLPATCFLRNIIAGEKYVEPVQTMTVIEETSGQKAVVTFKAGGMFSGRSEDVSVQCFDAASHTMLLSMHGKWTTELKLSYGGGKEKTIWTAGKLIRDAPTRYGMTAFSATLNEITELEKNALPPTDSRLRPDQQAHEAGDTDKAEKLKAALEEGQRRRRREMEQNGETWQTHWFEKVSSEGEEEMWRMKEHEGYWEVRQAVVDFKGGKWDGVRDVFET